MAPVRSSIEPIASTRSEFLLERTDFEFHRPRARILMRKMPVGLRDRLGLKKVAVAQARLQSARPWNIDTAIDVDPRHVNTPRTKIARERLRQPTHRELRRSKRDRLRPSLHARRRPSEKHRAMPARNHAGRHF